MNPTTYERACHWLRTSRAERMRGEDISTTASIPIRDLSSTQICRGGERLSRMVGPSLTHLIQPISVSLQHQPGSNFTPREVGDDMRGRWHHKCPFSVFNAESVQSSNAHMTLLMETRESMESRPHVGCRTRHPPPALEQDERGGKFHAVVNHHPRV